MSPLPFLRTPTKAKSGLWLGGVRGGLDELRWMKGLSFGALAKALAAGLVIGSFAACQKTPGTDSAAPIESAAPPTAAQETPGEMDPAKKARAAAFAEKEAIKRAVEFAQSAAAAAKNAAAAAERAAAAAEAAVEAIKKIPPGPSVTTPATPKPAK